MLAGFSAPASAQVCGNNRLESPPEECDDGNTMAGDGCSDMCAVEPGFVCEDVTFTLNVREDLGVPGAGLAWVLDADERGIAETANSIPGVYSTNMPADVGEIVFDMRVETDADDDFFGWTIGYDAGEMGTSGTPATTDFLLFTWKQQEQAFGASRHSGLQLSRVTGDASEPDYWVGNQGNITRLAVGNQFPVDDSLVAGERVHGWEDNRWYRVNMVVTGGRVRVWIRAGNMADTTDPTMRGMPALDRVAHLEFDVATSIPPGNFGFYAHSQSNLRYDLVGPQTDSLCSRDTDNDGTKDSSDLDSDRDGVLDLEEMPGFTGDPDADEDLDGVPDWQDPDTVPGGCTSAGGVCTSLPMALDADGDGVPNHLDLDSDGDGITDARESGLTDDNGDGRPDACTTVTGDGVCTAGGLVGAPTATDGDGLPDYLDPDSDGDGITDTNEAFDSDNDEVANTSPAGADTDGDGIDDAFDPDCNAALCGGVTGAPITGPLNAAQDSDLNGTPDWQVVCSDSYLTGAEVCDDGNTVSGDGCDASCDLETGYYCDSGPPAGPCSTGGPGTVTELTVDLTSPVGAQASTSVTPTGTTTAPDGATIAIAIAGPGGPFMCSAMVSGGAWMCPSAVMGLVPGSDYTATATVMVGAASASDAENLNVGPCVGAAQGAMCSDGRGGTTVMGICSLAGAMGTCVPCVDNTTGSMTDFGCSDSAPICEGATTGGAGTGCTACVADTDGGTDLGCELPGRAGPVCDTTGPTDICVACEITADAIDNGCSAATPQCMLAIGMAPVCVECTADAHCPAMGEVCGGANTCVPGCNEASDCAGTAMPICDTAARVCVECLADTDCDGDEICGAGGTCDAPDSDMDGVPDDVDIDDDNDGIPDTVEGGGTDFSVDTDGDGWPDYKDPDSVTCADTTPMDGACDVLPMSVDFDQDGVPNHLDLDADGDGVPDVVEAGGADDNGDGRIDGFADLDGNGMADSVDATALPTPDTDTDTAPDFLDLDADGDGLTDAFEAGGTDADGDGREDTAFVDANNDGLNDNLTGAMALPLTDTDGDGAPDFQDVDADGDGVPDATEGHLGTAPAGSDMDGDGIDDAFDPDCTAAMMCGAVVGVPSPVPNTDGPADSLPDFRDIDADGDGITDGVECPMPAACADSDMDGTPDFRSLDSDSDGLPDAQEGHDVDHDGAPDVTPAGVDTDGDGLDDAFDADCTMAAPCGAVVGVPAPTPDLDMDGTPDFQDPDDDGDGKPTAEEIQDAADYTGPATVPTDIDEDGLSNWFDIDSDGDGASDMTENSGDGDLNDDGILDYLDPGFAPLDTDGDGIIDYEECGMRFPADATCRDSDGDGVPDWQDVDDDNDGVLTIVEYAADDPEDGDPANDHDADNDGIPNHLDLDADNDGIPDITENGHAAADADGDGRADVMTDADMDGLLALFDMDDMDAANAMTAAPVDTDMTGAPDFLDLDADGDGLLDILEANGTDTDGDGVVDDAADADMDGLADVVDGSPWPTPDTDEDGKPDFQDVDSDGDGASDAVEGSDANHDGVADILPSGIDADGNGIDDIFEMAGNAPSQPDTDMDGTPDWRDVDDDEDGVPSAIEFSVGDTDGDGVPDYLDTDDDGDTVPTAMENPDPNGDRDPADAQDTDMDGTPDYLDPDDDGDGVLTRFERPDPNGDGNPDDAQDTDTDTTPDYLDPDDDGDGIPTADEMADPNGDGDPADAIDIDGNGLPNYLDPNPSTTGGVSGGALCAASAPSGSAPLGPLGFTLAVLGLLGWRRRRSVR